MSKEEKLAFIKYQVNPIIEENDSSLIIGRNATASEEIKNQRTLVAFEEANLKAAERAAIEEKKEKEAASLSLVEIYEDIPGGSQQ